VDRSVHTKSESIINTNLQQKLFNKHNTASRGMSNYLMQYKSKFLAMWIMKSYFYRATLCQCGICCRRVSVCLSQASTAPKWLNVGSHKQRHTIAQGLSLYLRNGAR